MEIHKKSSQIYALTGSQIVHKKCNHLLTQKAIHESTHSVNLGSNRLPAFSCNCKEGPWVWPIGSPHISKTALKKLFLEIIHSFEYSFTNTQVVKVSCLFPVSTIHASFILWSKIWKRNSTESSRNIIEENGMTKRARTKSYKCIKDLKCESIQSYNKGLQGIRKLDTVLLHFELKLQEAIECESN